MKLIQNEQVQNVTLCDSYTVHVNTNTFVSFNQSINSKCQNLLRYQVYLIELYIMGLKVYFKRVSKDRDFESAYQYMEINWSPDYFDRLRTSRDRSSHHLVSPRCIMIKELSEVIKISL